MRKLRNCREKKSIGKKLKGENPESSGLTSRSAGGTPTHSGRKGEQRWAMGRLGGVGRPNGKKKKRGGRGENTT